MPTFESTPDKVYFKNDEFFGPDRVGMGGEFRSKWYSRSDQFPTNPEEACVAIDEDGIHGNKFYVELLDISSRILVALVANSGEVRMSHDLKDALIREAVELAKILQGRVRELEC